MTTYKKKIIPYPELYIVDFTKTEYKESLIFIHGGPGFNCGILEYLIEHENLFECLNYNIIMYDQRECGRSEKNHELVSHQDNLKDLKNIIDYFVNSNIPIKGLIGHSYGAKLLYDFYLTYPSTLPGIFVGIADSMLTPRLNNLLSDLTYLRKNDPDRYQDILPRLNKLTLEKLWMITEELAPVFESNKDRPFNYFANLELMQKVQEISKVINIPINKEVLMSVRKDIYASKELCKVEIANLKNDYLWINGFHDSTMNSTNSFLKNQNIILFYQSAHYPHIEESRLFCETVNEFLKRL